MNYQQRSRAQSECIRTRCERTVMGLKAAFRHAAELSIIALLMISFAVLWLRGLMPEFARVSRAIIDGAGQSRNSLSPQLAKSKISDKEVKNQQMNR